jgi:toxin ParE1/3/4
MTYRFTIEAKTDLFSAVQFYESQREGLGTEFAIEFGLALARVLEAPRRWPEGERGTRRYRLDRFPYAIVYKALPSVVEIVAVFDLRREPGSWRRDQN